MIKKWEMGIIKKREKKKAEKIYREFVRRGSGRREIDVESHRAAQCWAEMLVSLVVSSKHL